MNPQQQILLPNEVSWLTVLTALIIGLPLILGGLTTLIALLWKIYKGILENTKITKQTKQEVSQNKVDQDSAIRMTEEKAKRVAMEEAAKAAQAVAGIKEDLKGIAKTINGHTDKRVDAASEAAFAKGKLESVTEYVIVNSKRLDDHDKRLSHVSDRLDEMAKWQKEHAEMDAENAKAIQISLDMVIDLVKKRNEMNSGEIRKLT